MPGTEARAARRPSTPTLSLEEQGRLTAVTRRIDRIFSSDAFLQEAAKDRLDRKHYNERVYGSIDLGKVVLERKGFAFGLEKSDDGDITVVFSPLLDQVETSDKMPQTVISIPADKAKPLWGATHAGIGALSATSNFSQPDTLKVLEGVADAFSDLTNESPDEVETDPGLGRLIGITKALSEGAVIQGLKSQDSYGPLRSVSVSINGKGMIGNGDAVSLVEALARADAAYLTDGKTDSNETWAEYHALRWKHLPEVTPAVTALDNWMEKRNGSWEAFKAESGKIMVCLMRWKGSQPLEVREAEGETFEIAVNNVVDPNYDAHSNNQIQRTDLSQTYDPVVEGLIQTASMLAVTAEPTETEGAFAIGMRRANEIISQYEARSGETLSDDQKSKILKGVKESFY